MAATRARCQGFCESGNAQNGIASRLGRGHAWAEAATWRTFVNVLVHADGTTRVEIKRDGKLLSVDELGPEEKASDMHHFSGDDLKPRKEEKK